MCLSVCVSVCVSVKALAPNLLDGFQRHSGFEVGQRFASGVFFILFEKNSIGDEVTAVIL